MKIKLILVGVYMYVCMYTVSLLSFSLPSSMLSNMADGCVKTLLIKYSETKILSIGLFQRATSPELYIKVRTYGLSTLATVAELGDKLSPKSATIISSVDRPLDI